MTRRTGLLVAGGFVALLLLVLLFALSDLQELARRARELQPGPAALAVLAALLSYAGIGGCNRALLRLLGHDVPLGVMVRACFVSTAANRNLRSGGATGFAVLAWLLSRRGVPSGAVLGSTAGFLLITNAAFGLLFLAAVPVAAATVTDRPAVALVLGLAAAGFVASLVVGGAAVFHDGLRARWSRRVLSLVRRLADRAGADSWHERAAGFFARFDAAARLLYERRRATGPAWAWSAMRILCSVACLWLAVAATGARLDAAALLLAYTAGKTAGTLSLVPSGLGIVEGSLAGVLVLFGLEYEQALLAALAWRATYHLAPAAVALLAFGPLLREARAGVAEKWPGGESETDSESGR